MSVNLVTMVKGRPNKEASAKVINALLSAPIQERIVEYIGSVPANSRAKPPARLRDVLPPLGDLYRPDWEYVNAHFGEWVDRWNREIAAR
jgi:ABC-type thiamine transport system substrate-binding protein